MLTLSCTENGKCSIIYITHLFRFVYIHCWILSDNDKAVLFASLEILTDLNGLPVFTQDLTPTYKPHLCSFAT